VTVAGVVGVVWRWRACMPDKTYACPPREKVDVADAVGTPFVCVCG